MARAPHPALAQAVAAAQRKDFPRAVELLGAILKANPNDAALWFNRAVMLQQLGRQDDAVADYDKALALRPRDPDAWFNRAVACEALGRSEDALNSYNRALADRPAHLGALNNRGAVFAALGRHDDALHDFERVLALKPDDARTLYNKANALRGLDRPEEALALYDRVLTINPKHADAWTNRGLALEMMERSVEALESHREAIKRGGASMIRHLNANMALLSQNRIEDALRETDAALAIDPHAAPARFAKSMALLTLGRLSEGWPYYEDRWNAGDAQPLPRIDAPVWNGADDVAGKTILLHGEQGLGDTLQFARFAAPLAERGARVALRVQPSLKGLLGDSLAAPIAEIVGYDEPAPKADLWAPLMSLPLALGATLESITASAAPYLTADPVRVAAWAQRLGPRNRPRIGIVWRGDIGSRVRARRAMPLKLFALLFGADAEFISLQLQLAGLDEAGLLKRHGVQHFGDALSDFRETAALIACCDLVITVDTSVAHLAGALGKPVWILLRHWGDWRWLLIREDSPWYPTARLFRQRAPGAWSDVIERGGEALGAWLAERGA